MKQVARKETLLAMKTPDEIVKFIDDWERHMLERPDMYASSPQSLEEQLMLLENLRAFITNDEPGFPSHRPFQEYARRVGKCEAMSFTGMRINEVWSDLCKFFQAYLVSQGRVEDKRKKTTSKRQRKR